MAEDGDWVEGVPKLWWKYVFPTQETFYLTVLTRALATSIEPDPHPWRRRVTGEVPRLALWEIACHTPAQKLIRVGRDISPSGYPLSARRLCSPSREFSFALHQIQHAIEPHISFQQTLYSWNQIAQALAEKSRYRLRQLAKLCGS